MRKEKSSPARPAPEGAARAQRQPTAPVLLTGSGSDERMQIFESAILHSLERGNRQLLEALSAGLSRPAKPTSPRKTKAKNVAVKRQAAGGRKL
jgi:hypothetical protein